MTTMVVYGNNIYLGGLDSTYKSFFLEMVASSGTITSGTLLTLDNSSTSYVTAFYMDSSTSTLHACISQEMIYKSYVLRFSANSITSVTLGGSY